jgi:hypothetical protein
VPGAPERVLFAVLSYNQNFLERHKRAQAGSMIMPYGCTFLATAGAEVGMKSQVRPGFCGGFSGWPAIANPVPAFSHWRIGAGHRPPGSWDGRIEKSVLPPVWAEARFGCCRSRRVPSLRKQGPVTTGFGCWKDWGYSAKARER